MPAQRADLRGETRRGVARVDARTKELVKIQFSKNSDATAKDAANDLAREMKADVVQTIGRTATLYRENPERHK